MAQRVRMMFDPKSSILNTLLGDIKPAPIARQVVKRPSGRTEAQCLIELDELLTGVGFDTYWEIGVRHPSGKLLKVDLLAIRDGYVIAFEVKKEDRDKLAWAFRQARDYVLAKSMWGMVLAWFMYPSFVSRHGDDYERGMAKLASYDRVGTCILE